MRQETLPSCLETNDIEMYRSGNKLVVVQNGNKCKFSDLAPKYRKPFEQEFEDDQIARDCLEHEMKVEGDRFTKFKWCRYGNFDHTPDLVNGVTQPDAPNCREEKTCKGFSKVCLIPGGLTPQQYFITRLIALGKQDKEIADELDISIATVRTHYTHIRVNLQVNNRNEIALWAHKKGIV